MKSTIFHKDTGAWLYYGHSTNPEHIELAKEGHKVVEGEYSKAFKYDNGVIPNPDYVDPRIEREESRKRKQEAVAEIASAEGDFKNGDQLDVEKVNTFLLQIRKYAL